MNIRNWSYDTSSYIHEYTMHNEHIIFQSFVKIHKTRHSKTKNHSKLIIVYIRFIKFYHSFKMSWMVILENKQLWEFS